MIKLSDYVFSYLKEKGVDTVFYLPGGGCMHLLDSLGANESIKSVSLLHEQAVSIAVEAYANTRGTPGVALVTTGPGGTNTVTGVLAAYIDSTPCFFISGQVKTADLKSRYDVRAHGSQEADIVSIVSSITKYAVMVKEPAKIRYHLDCAWHEMTTGRRGPVWIDLPLDVQGAQIEPDTLEGRIFHNENTPVDVTGIIDMINQSHRPVVIAGNGLMGCKESFHALMDLLQFPVIPTWKAMDYIPNNHPLYAGRAGGMGDRHGNLAMQNADLLLSFGSRLDFSITGYDRTEWATKAKKVIVDVDPAEIGKLDGASSVFPVIADAKDVIEALIRRINEIEPRDISEWKSNIAGWKRKYPIKPLGNLTTYAFIDALCELLPENAYIAPCSAGTTAEIFFQAFTVKKGQVVRSSHGLGSMGFEIPNAIGMCIASGCRETICVAGDGGMQLNIQELAVIKGRNLPIKIFVINNGGYASIRNMQHNLFQDRRVGCDDESGLYLPEMRDVALAYGFSYFKIENIDPLSDTVKMSLEKSGPVICEISVDAECLVMPRTTTMVMPDGTMRSSPLENQFPFLSDEEVEKNKLL